MKIQIIIFLVSITLSKAFAQYDFNDPYYKSASNIAIQNGQFLKSPNMSRLKNDVIFVANHTFTIATNGEIPTDFKKSRYFYDEEFHIGELLLTDKRYFKMEYTYRFDLLTGNIELKNQDNKTLTLNIQQVVNFSIIIKDKFFNFNQINVQGAPYFYSADFHQGELILSKNRRYKSEFKYRFNQYLGTLEIQYPDNQIFALDNKEVMAFSLNIENKVISFMQIGTTDTNEFKLLQAIYFSPTIKLLRDSNKDIVRESDMTSGYLSSSKMVSRYLYKENYHYFISKVDQPLVEVQLTEKSLAKVFPEKKKILKKLFAQSKYKEDLTVSKVQDLMQALDKTDKKIEK